MFSEEMNALWWVLKKQIKIESVYLLLRHPVYYEEWHPKTPHWVSLFFGTPLFLKSCLFATEQFALIITEFLFCFWLIARKQFCVFFRPDLRETLFMARGQLLSLILARQHRKVADPWSRVMTTEKKISLLWHEMSFLLCMKNFKTIFENFTKSSPTNPIFWPHLPKILGFLVCGAQQRQFASLNTF